MSASRASSLMSCRSSAPPCATFVTVRRSTVRRSTCSAQGSLIASSNRTPQSTSGTYRSSAPLCPGSMLIWIVPDGELLRLRVGVQRDVRAGERRRDDGHDHRRVPRGLRDPVPVQPRQPRPCATFLRCACWCHPHSRVVGRSRLAAQLPELHHAQVPEAERAVQPLADVSRLQGRARAAVVLRCLERLPHHARREALAARLRDRGDEAEPAVVVVVERQRDGGRLAVVVDPVARAGSRSAAAPASAPAARRSCRTRGRSRARRWGGLLGADRRCR